MDSAAIWALGGIGLLAVVAYPHGSGEGSLIPVTQQEGLRLLDGHSQEVYGTGLGGLRISSQRAGSDTAKVTIHRIRSGEEIACRAKLTPADAAQVSVEMDCITPMESDGMGAAQRAALKILTPVAQEYVVSTITRSNYEAEGVVDDMIEGMHDPDIGVHGDLGF